MSNGELIQSISEAETTDKDLENALKITTTLASFGTSKFDV
jgi:hypothetical protein